MPPLRWTRDNQKQMLDVMVVMYREGELERQRWDYAARRVCRRFCVGCNCVACDTGVGTVVTLVWVLVFLPRGLVKAMGRLVSFLFSVLESERVAYVWIGVLRFTLRWLSLVVTGAFVGVFVQALLAVVIQSI